jgi:uncharacterized protein YyaL (SSP411 family)
MEKESFEDEEIAKLLNDHFVSIKVDREERPDIDNIYMTVCQILTGSGGWPLTIVMTPDKKPFFAGTYFPKESRFGRAGLLELLPNIHEIWNRRRDEVLKSAESILESLMITTSSTEEINENILDKAYNQFRKRFDETHGGFNVSPKFPTPHNLFFLLRYWKRKSSTHALEMVEKTLMEMRRGGIFDHIGFGFHRYSTDEKWLVPHFEKMLYDQALLITAYTETYLATKNNFYRNAAEEIIEYVLRDLTSKEGGFYSAEDADSEGEEGKFYLWALEEVREILKGKAELFIDCYNIKEEGNWIDQLKGELDGTNIPHLKKSMSQLAAEYNLTEKELVEKLNEARKILFIERKKRIHPFKDDKILTDWNGLMISALALASQVFNKKEYSNAAEKAASFILSKMKDKSGKLLHRYRDGEAGLPASIDDYAFFIAGLLNIYETSFQTEYLLIAAELNEVLIQYFWDDKLGGFYFTSDDSEKLLIRQKEFYDGAIPSGNSIALLNLLRLGRFLGKTEYDAMASSLIKTFSANINSSPTAFTQFLSSVDFAFGTTMEIIIAGEMKSSDTLEKINIIRKKFLPNKVIIVKDENSGIEKLADFTKPYNTVNGKTAVYICQNFECKMPLTDNDEIDESLN